MRKKKKKDPENRLLGKEERGRLILACINKLSGMHGGLGLSGATVDASSPSWDNAVRIIEGYGSGDGP